MRFAATAIVFGIVLGYGIAGTEARAEGGYLSAQQLKELYSGAVVEGRNRRDHPYKISYKADGTYSGQNYRNSFVWNGTWRVDDQGRICSTGNRGERCRKVKHEGGVKFRHFNDSGSSFVPRFTNKEDFAKNLAK